MLVINAVFKLIYLFFLIFKYLDVSFRKFLRFEITKKDNDYYEIVKPHAHEVIYAIYFFYRQLAVNSFLITLGLILYSIITITYSGVLLKRLTIFLYFYSKEKSVYLFYIFTSLKFNYFILDFIFMFIILYYNYINIIFKKIFYFIKYQYELVTFLDSDQLIKKQNNETSPDLKVYYPMEYAMKSVMVRLTGIALFTLLLLVLILEFITTYISPNLVLLFFPLFQLKYIQIMHNFELQFFYEYICAKQYFNTTSKSFLYLVKCIIYLAYYTFSICLLFFCYFLKIFFYLSWILMNEEDYYAFFKIMYYYNFFKNSILMFFIAHIYYTFNHTYIFIREFFMDSLIFFIICSQIIKFYLKILINYLVIIICYFLAAINIKKPPFFF